MSHQDYGQMSGGAQAGCGQRTLDRAASRREPKVLEQLGSHLVSIRDRIRNLHSRCEALSNRAFGAINEISRSPEGLVSPSAAIEVPGSIPALMNLAAELEKELSVLNKSIDKLETLA